MELEEKTAKFLRGIVTKNGAFGGVLKVSGKQIALETELPVEALQERGDLCLWLNDKLPENEARAFICTKLPISNRYQWVLALWAPGGNPVSLFSAAALEQAIVEELRSSVQLTDCVCTQKQHLPRLVDLLHASSLIDSVVAKLTQVGIQTAAVRNTSLPRTSREIVSLATAHFRDDSGSLHRQLEFHQDFDLDLSHSAREAIQALLQPAEHVRALGLMLDDSTKKVTADIKILREQTIVGIANLFRPESTEYYLIYDGKKLLLVLHTPERRDPVPRFFYPLCKAHVRMLLEREVGPINQTIDLRHGDNIANHLRKEQPINLQERYLVMGEALPRVRPIFRGQDPFLRLHSKFDKTLKQFVYKLVPGNERFRF